MVQNFKNIWNDLSQVKKVAVLVLIVAAAAFVMSGCSATSAKDLEPEIAKKHPAHKSSVHKPVAEKPETNKANTAKVETKPSEPAKISEPAPAPAPVVAPAQEDATKVDTKASSPQSIEEAPEPKGTLKQIIDGAAKIISGEEKK